MGRKNIRDMWTARLMDSLADRGVDPAPPLSASAARKAQAPAAHTKAGQFRPAGTHASAVASASAIPAENFRSKQSVRAGVKAAAGVGHRAPFHGVVLGIDPSLRGTGIAVVRFSPPAQPRLLYSTTVRNKPVLTPAQCLGAIARTVSQAIETYQPACVALEQTVYVQNVKTSLTLGSARGAAIAPAAMQGLEIFEYAPARLKQAVVGSGRASKEQVAGMVKSLLQAGRDLLPSDEADAAAAALCHAFTFRA